MDISKVIKEIKDHDFFEVYHKTSFKCYKDNDDGSSQQVDIDIFDAGSEKGNLRYSIEARAENGNFATGNPASSIDEALDIVHWGDLN